MAVTAFIRRRAERFAQLLDQMQGRASRHSRAAVDDELAGYVALSRAVSGRVLTRDERPDPDFRAGLRAMLVATAEREGIGSTADERTQVVGPVYLSSAAQVGAPRSTRRPVVVSRRTRGAIVVGIAAGTLALSGMSMASGDAMPGDPLYGVKRSTENAQLAMTGSDVDRGEVYLGFARNRVMEAESVRGDTGKLDSALADMDNETTHGVKLLTTTALSRHDAAALDLVDDFVSNQRPAVTRLADGLSGAARVRAEHSVDLLDRVGRRTADLRAALSCGPATSGSDSLGPKPPTCPGASRAGQTGSGDGH